jgi:two-component system OmpR family sensor kinase
MSDPAAAKPSSATEPTSSDAAQPASTKALSGGSEPAGLEQGEPAVRGDAEPVEPTTARPAPAPPLPAGPRDRWAGVPLSVKLVAAMLALMAVALSLIGVASVVALRDYLVDRIDSQLTFAVSPYAQESPTLQGGYVPPTDFFVSVQDGVGRYAVIYDKHKYKRDQLPDLNTLFVDAPAHTRKHYTVFAIDHSRRWRVVPVIQADGSVLTVGEDMSNVESAMERLVLINLFVGMTVLVALGLFGAWVVRRSLRPLTEIETTAGAIAAGDLGRRVPDLDERTELGRLSSALNTMLEQIESAFRARAASEHRAVRSEERMRQFVANASHELRTPLTTIRGFAELYRQGAADDPAAVLRRIESEAARMGLLVEDLLLLARLDEERPLHQSPVAMADLVRDAATAAHAIAPDRLIEVSSESGLVVLGDEARLRQVIGNLVTNALRHTPAGTPVSLRLRRDADYAVVEVADAGPGLTPEQAERVFERFFRVDKARTRAAARAADEPGPPSQPPPHTGAGLGLAIVAALVAAHGGTVDVTTQPGAGATFRVRVPLAP